MDMEVIGYTSGGSTVVSIPDLWELEERDVLVFGMPRAADGALVSYNGSPRVPGYALVNEYHPVGYTYRGYARLLDELEYAGQLDVLDTHTEFCRNKRPDYKSEPSPYNFRCHCTLCGKATSKGHAADGHQYGWLFKLI